MNKHEEVVPYSDWTDKRKPLKSQYVDGLKLYGGVDLRCPRSGHTKEMGLEHGEMWTCPCDLTMILHGNALTLTELP